MLRKIISSALAVLLYSNSLLLLAIDEGIAPCPLTTDPTKPEAPTRKVALRIKSIKALSNLDAGYLEETGRADFYGNIKIDGEEFRLPKKEDDDKPIWTEAEGKFVKAAAAGTNLVNILIEIMDSDIHNDDVVDINPNKDRTALAFTFDLCSLQVSGKDLPTQSSGGTIVSSGDDVGEGATIIFEVDTEDSKSGAIDDIALRGVDLIQVVPKVKELAANKPTIAVVTVSSTYSVPMTTYVNLNIGVPGGVSRRDRIQFDLGPYQVLTKYLYINQPIKFTTAQPKRASVSAGLDLASSGYQSDCRAGNDTTGGKKFWKVVRMGSLSLTWAKVNTPNPYYNGPKWASQSEFDAIRSLGDAFIKGTYPIAVLSSTVNPFNDQIFTSGDSLAALNFLVFVLKYLTPYGDRITALSVPFVLVFELGNQMGNGGRLIGVLPRSDWLRSIPFWGNRGGLSLGETFPGAVIVTPTLDTGSINGPQLALPTHELGHTFGLSVDPTLKGSWLCHPIFGGPGGALCGAVGGLDEYKNPDKALQRGNPSSGFWVAQGGEPPSLLPLLNTPQCDSRCFMGSTYINAQNDWPNNKSWIDPADYEQLFQKLRIERDPEVIYLSGILSADNKVFLGPWYHYREGVPDNVTSSTRFYVVRFLDAHGTVMKEEGLPINWARVDEDLQFPVSFFGLKFPFPALTRKIQIFSKQQNAVLAERTVSAHFPSIRVASPTVKVTVRQGTPLDVKWTANDLDRDALTYVVQVSGDGVNWWQASPKLSETSFHIPTVALKAGTYSWRILATDGIHVENSLALPFVVRVQGGVDDIR